MVQRLLYLYETNRNPMKKLLLSVLFLFAFLPLILAQGQLSPKATAKSANAEVVYGQPSKRSRVIFGDVVPYNELWRAGANEATQISFKKDVDFGGTRVKAGTYTIFILPTEKEWTIILNSEMGQWGHFDYEQHKAKNVAEIKVPVTRLDKVQEKLTYNANDNSLTIEWDQTGVSIPLKY
jgi:hypothetical protein